jgi:hypothetical protein
VGIEVLTELWVSSHSWVRRYPVMDSEPVSYSITPIAGLIGHVKRALRDEGVACYESGEAGLCVSVDPSEQDALQSTLARVRDRLQAQLNLRAFVYGLRSFPADRSIPRSGTNGHPG